MTPAAVVMARASNWYEIKNKSGEPAEVLIYEEIGGWGINAKDFVADLKATGAKKVNVRINSPGGSVFDGLAIYNFLRGLDTTVTIDGLAASSASIVAMSGKTIRMAENAFLMIHNPYGLVVGDSDEMRALADSLDKIREQIVKTYARRTSKESDQIARWMDEETWFNFEEAKSNGFVDESSEPVPQSALAAFNLSRFSKVPPSLPVDTPEKGNMSTSATTELSQKMFDELKASFDAVTTEFSAFKASHKTELDTLAATHKAELLSKDAVWKSQLDAKDLEVEKRAAAKAQEIVAALGVPPVKATPEPATPVALSYEQHWEHYNKLPQADRRAYYLKNEAVMGRLFNS